MKHIVKPTVSERFSSTKTKLRATELVPDVPGFQCGRLLDLHPDRQSASGTQNRERERENNSGYNPRDSLAHERTIQWYVKLSSRSSVKSS